MLTNKMLFRNRVYDVETMRWLQVDPLMISDGLNLYQATRSNVTNYLDPAGTRSYVTETNDQITVNVDILFISDTCNSVSGLSAKDGAAAASRIASGAEKVWNSLFGNLIYLRQTSDSSTLRYKTISLKVNHEYKAIDSSKYSEGPSDFKQKFSQGEIGVSNLGKPGQHLILLESGASDSWVGKLVTNNKQDVNGLWYTDAPKGDRTFAHELGHLIGLDDRYHEVGNLLIGRRTDPDNGWKGNLMSDGVLQVRAGQVTSMLRKLGASNGKAFPIGAAGTLKTFKGTIDWADGKLTANYDLTQWFNENHIPTKEPRETLSKT